MTTLEFNYLLEIIGLKVIKKDTKIRCVITASLVLPSHTHYYIHYLPNSKNSVYIDSNFNSKSLSLKFILLVLKRVYKETDINSLNKCNIFSNGRSPLEMNPQGKRKSGSPRTTWRRTVHQKLNKAETSWQQIKHLTQNRPR